MTHPPRMGRINPTQNDGQYYKSAYVTGALIGQSEDATSRLSFDDRVAAERHVNDAPRSQWSDRRRRTPADVAKSLTSRWAKKKSNIPHLRLDAYLVERAVVAACSRSDRSVRR
jgi:hypothetical protein